MLINLIVALVPVVAFLLALFLMDSFRLVRPASIGAAMAWGGVAAIASLVANDELMSTWHIPSSTVTRYLAPVIEETVKAAPLVLLIVTGRIGFLVDAAVQGFAVGTGFALLENLSYVGAMPDASIALWIVRGFGTAVLQGGTTAIFAMVFKALVDRHADRIAFAVAPGWLAAVVIHSLFNHRFLPAVAETCILLIVLPLLMLAVFTRSERATREWIGAGLDLDIELLQLVGSEYFEGTRFGQYLRQLRTRLPGSVVADMFCLLRLDLELAVQAKAMLMAREAGLEVPIDDDLDLCLAERRYLQESIGTTGLLALKPLQVTGRRDQWHRHLLRERSRSRRRRS